jgi:hypothetical protein
MPEGTLRAILKQAGLEPEEFLKMFLLLMPVMIQQRSRGIFSVIFYQNL